MEINELVKKAHENAVNHGFWNPPLNFGTAIALIHSELSEALEEEREGNPDFWFKDVNGFKATDTNEWRGERPEGVAVELADAVIRIADLCGHLGIDLDAVIRLKMAYNEGHKRKAVEVVADSVYFADAKKEGEAGSYAANAYTSGNFEELGDDEEIPF